MTLLQINKRAETAEEGLELIDRSIKLCDPFDSPTLCITNQDLSDWNKKTKSILKPVTESLFQRAWKLFKGPNIADSVFISESLKFGHVEQKARDVLESKPFQGLSHEDKIAASILLGLQFQLRMLGIEADSIPASSHLNLFSRDISASLDSKKIKALSVSIVNIDGKDRLLYQSKSKIESFHGADRFSTIWHEFAHSAGANEPQADMMSAIVTRQAFSPSDLLRRIADERAIDAVTHFENESVRENYGWGVVDANDFVASLSDEKILGISEEEIKSIKFQKFNSLGDAIYRVGKVVKEDPDHLTMHINKTFRDDKQAQYICQRFAYACERLEAGRMGFFTMPDLPDNQYPSFIDIPEF